MSVEKVFYGAAGFSDGLHGRIRLNNESMRLSRPSNLDLYQTASASAFGAVLGGQSSQRGGEFGVFLVERVGAAVELSQRGFTQF